MNISIGDFHLKEYVRCKGCRRAVSWDQMRDEQWGSTQSSTDIFGVWVPGFVKYWCPPCFKQHHLWWLP